MSTLADFQFDKGEDVTGTVTMSPTVNVSGWAVRFEMWDRYGGSLLVTRDNGANGGVAVTDSTNGVFTFNLPSSFTSTLAPGVYAYQFARTDAGAFSVLSQGSAVCNPEAGR